MRKRFLLLVLLLSAQQVGWAWGFYAHQRINRQAVYTLPPEMIGFFKQHLSYLTEQAVAPDKRRYAVPEEGARHFIDLDVYGDSAAYKLPRHWEEAVRQFTLDTLQRHGIVPWHIGLVQYQLTQAFKEHEIPRILRLSAELGHYLADACVPLHTTRNYNGQFTNQRGIHGLWESRLPELWAKEYDFFIGPPQHLANPGRTAWEIVARSNAALDSVFSVEKQLSQAFPEDKKYSLEERGTATVKVYSREFSQAYHRGLKGQVERQMRLAIHLVASYWYTAWVNAGQPDLKQLAPLTPEQKQQLELEKAVYQTGEHDARQP
ncbi:zinc dependent phospholipase C family protein [Rufibacter latericius]|uniref:S1/P1 Nuclease n=1 Tax=Rufibacter latericius TaxID=2487040 RepID=A0A3M9MTN8_9BACT|nr:zinc dependent phospholipase C family protein [Rufibacter latericius]RNI28886.1 S1/P1 Nuclease [Rufibacter latericius]